mgnify:CR=1 FL=1
MPATQPTSPDWFESPLGRWLVGQECRRSRELIPDGYYPTALQIGLPGHDFLCDLDDVEVGTKFVTISSRDNLGASVNLAADTGRHAMVARPGALPFGDKTHSLIVLPHALDFCDDPHRVLREVNQVLTPEGYVVIIGFNQLSLWGLCRYLPGVKKYDSAPWRGRSYRAGRVQDWLSLLGIDIVGARMLAYHPPLQSHRWRDKLGFLDRMGDRWWPGLGAVYMIVGRKREFARGDGTRRLAWRRFIPAIARPAVTASGLPNSATGGGRSRLRLVVKNQT